MTLPSAETIFFALAGGVLPALLWLWFWLQEDRLHPEPRSMIIRTFIIGMIAVPIVLPIEQIIQYSFFPKIGAAVLGFVVPHSFTAYAAYLSGILPAQIWVVILWAAAEEILKWSSALLAALDTKEYDEPIDAVVYLLTAALGFSAMENTFFLLTSVAKTGFAASFVTGNLRFIGATLLHVLSSGVVGLFMGLSFSKNWFAKMIYLLFGLALAILLHTVFNLYIMKSGDKSIFIVFCFVWAAILLLIAGFEKVKRLSRYPKEL